MCFKLESIELEEPAPKLTWKRQPEDSFSDWKIIVKTKGHHDSNKIYHVHKCVVGAGRRASQYFLKAFKSKGLTESETSTSELELSRAETRNFPQFLDFVYGHLTDFDFEEPIEDRMVLRHFADYFGVPTLLKEINKSITAHMNEKNIVGYVQQAQLYNDKKIIKATMHVAAKHYESLVASFHDEASDQYLDLFTSEQQVEVLKLSLKEAVSECSKFKPSSSKSHVKKPTPFFTDQRSFGVTKPFQFNVHG